LSKSLGNRQAYVHGYNIAILRAPVQGYCDKFYFTFEFEVMFYIVGQ